MRSLATRCRRPERMDDPSLPAPDHRQALAGLARINAISGSAAVFWSELEPFCRAAGRPLRLLDLASGGGDVALALWRKARTAGLPLAVDGCDRDETAVGIANHRAAGAEVRFFRHDALADPLPDGYDIVTSSLFLHHLSDDEAAGFLARLASTRLAMVQDLDRSPLGWLLAWGGTRLLSRSPVVHFDGPVSVEAAFTVREAAALARRAGWQQPRVRAWFPCRWLLSRSAIAPAAPR